LTATFPHQTKPILVTNVLDEGGPAIYGQFDTPVPEDYFPSIAAASLGDDRAATVVSSSYYPPPAPADGSDDARPQLKDLASDYIWRCPGWTFARNWAQNGGAAYVGEYQIGASYPSNSGISYCTQSGSVCHQDDIEIVFGTVSSPSADQAALTKEMQARYKSFMTSGNPNAAGYATWTKATSSNVQPLALGKSVTVDVGACDPSFWGAAVPYDYQVYSM